ncbi:hypothetical protein J3458_008764 [Metarhizium acridum]|uniref:uncharacterized protein n=1 Tax=Metarhizium acridum TaxID=92637 RepID=UPI001C6C0E33|nr:hypothetical protein J3458_008764 [Metarhizium acridum]
MSMGLHRDLKYLPLLSLYQCQMRKRLWATTMGLVIQHELDSGVPLLSSQRNYDTSLLQNCNDDLRDLEDEVAKCTPNHPTANSLQTALAESTPLRMEIVRLLNGLNNEPSFDQVIALGAKYEQKHARCVLAFASQVIETSSSGEADAYQWLFELANVGGGSFQGCLGLLVLGMEVFLQLGEQEHGQKGDRPDQTLDESRGQIVDRLDAICACETGIELGSMNMKAYYS